nr:MAG TPA: hypothetical protein [Caudoviricetes sp.]
MLYRHFFHVLLLLSWFAPVLSSVHSPRHHLQFWFIIVREKHPEECLLWYKLY